MDTAAGLSEFLDHQFFERGAFITGYETGKVILGKGGDFHTANSNSRVTNTFYLKDFYSDRFLAYSPQSFFETTLEELIEVVKTWELKPLEVDEMENEDLLYARDFNKLTSQLGDKLKKVVLVSREEFCIKGALGARKNFFVRSLMFGTGYPSGIWFDDYGMVGSTPEILFSAKENHIRTFALAGTAPLEESHDLMNSPKDREEHNLVISDIKEKLLTFGKVVRIGDTGLQPYKKIVHLKTDIELISDKEIPAFKLVQALSPTAALGGYPQKEAMQFLSETDYAHRHPNRYFGSAFGFSSPKFNQAVVMIRTIQWRGRKFIIESGGGVVKGSTLERELNEIYMKRESIKGHYL